MKRHIAHLGAVAVVAASTGVIALSSPASAGPPVVPTGPCSVGAIPFTQPLNFTTNTGDALKPGISAGQMLAMVGGQSVDTRLGGTTDRPYFLELGIRDELDALVSESRFTDGQEISLTFPANGGPNVKPYTITAAVGRAPSATGGDGCYSPLALTGATDGTIAAVDVVPVCSNALPPRSFDLGGTSIVGQRYTHTFNVITVGSGPLDVDILAIAGATLPAPIPVRLGNSVSFTPASVSTRVDYRTFLTTPQGGTWDQRVCFKYGFIFETGSSTSTSRGTATAPKPTKKPRSTRR
jgi:hypothetical protein